MSKQSVNVEKAADLLGSIVSRFNVVTSKLSDVSSPPPMKEVSALKEMSDLIQLPYPNQSNPSKEDINLWIALHTCYFHIILARSWKHLSPHCTKETCPRMTCGNKEFMWYREDGGENNNNGGANVATGGGGDNNNHRRPYVCLAAPNYIANVIEHNDNMLRQTGLETIVIKHFKSALATNDTTQIPIDMVNASKNLYKFSLRVFSHLYYRHIGHITALKERTSDASSPLSQVTPSSTSISSMLLKFHLQFQHFSLFAEHHKLIDSKQMELSIAAESRVNAFVAKILKDKEKSSSSSVAVEGGEGGGAASNKDDINKEKVAELEKKLKEALALEAAAQQQQQKQKGKEKSSASSSSSKHSKKKKQEQQEAKENENDDDDDDDDDDEEEEEDDDNTSKKKQQKKKTTKKQQQPKNKALPSSKRRNKRTDSDQEEDEEEDEEVSSDDEDEETNNKKKNNNSKYKSVKKPIKKTYSKSEVSRHKKSKNTDDSDQESDDDDDSDDDETRDSEEESSDSSSSSSEEEDPEETRGKRVMPRRKMQPKEPAFCRICW